MEPYLDAYRTWGLAAALTLIISVSAATVANPTNRQIPAAGIER